MATKYQGWTNRETWCAYLWIGNTETLYNRMRSLAKEGAIDLIREGIEHGCGTGAIRKDIGDTSKVNWQEIADALK